jgi:hypothetical protein
VSLVDHREGEQQAGERMERDVWRAQPPRPTRHARRAVLRPRALMLVRAAMLREHVCAAGCAVGGSQRQHARKRLMPLSKVVKPPKKLTALTARHAMSKYMDERADHKRLFISPLS